MDGLEIGLPGLLWIALLWLVLQAAPASAVTLERIKAADGVARDQFGASVDIDGETAIVGAPQHDASGADAGAAYVYVRQAGVWQLQQKLTAFDAADIDLFGTSVAISGDTVVVGALGDDDAGDLSGSAYVYTRTGWSWGFQQKLVAGDTAPGDRFGGSVDIELDTIVVGADSDDDDGSGSGSAYVFTRSAGTWTEQEKLTASDAAAGDSFGEAVAIGADTIVVGSERDDDTSTDSGSAYVFVLDAGTWSEQDKLVASDPGPNDLFGKKVAIDGDTIVVGVRQEDQNGSNAGAAYVFTRSGTSWTQEQKLMASDGEAFDFFGESVALRGDVALVGSIGDSDRGADSGAAYLFERAAGVWTEQTKLVADDGVTLDRLGWSVAIAQDHLIAGAVGDDLGSDPGSAFFGSLGPGTPQILQYMTVDGVIGGAAPPGPAGSSEILFFSIEGSSLSVVKALDSASPDLAEDASLGRVYSTVQLDVFEIGGSTTVPIQRIELTNAIISAYSVSSGGGVTTESVAFSFESSADVTPPQILQYMTVDGVIGDATPPGPAGSSEILSFSIDGTSLSVVKGLDSASSGLQEDASTGRVIPSVQLDVFEIGGSTTVPIQRIEFTNAIVSAYSLSGGAGGAATENVGFVFESYTELPPPPEVPGLSLLGRIALAVLSLVAVGRVRRSL
jgi:type VI protein secretion system component Hcp